MFAPLVKIAAIVLTCFRYLSFVVADFLSFFLAVSFFLFFVITLLFLTTMLLFLTTA